MAVEVAGILDEFMVKPEWMEQTTSALNGSLKTLNVAPGYNIMVTIAGRSYVLASDSKGQLSVTVVPNDAHCIAKAMARARGRATIDDKALKDWEQSGADWASKMFETRKIRYTGNVGLFNELQKELEPHVSKLRDAVDSAGPGSGAVKAAIEAFNAELEGNTMVEYDGLDDKLEIIAPEDGDNTLLMKCNAWLHFSAPSGFIGNVGQSNYCAANELLDQHTFVMRTSNWMAFEAITMMWGAVANLGMRWKAFASQDQLGKLDNSDDILMTALEAQTGLRYLVIPCNPPEWTTCAKGLYPPEWWNVTLFKSEDPFGWGKGKGGGVTMASSEANFHNMKDSAKDFQAPEPSTKGSWLFSGRRVRISGLEVHEEMNGMKGTLVEEVQPDLWHVILDDGAGEKLLRSKHIAQIHTSAAPAQEKVAAPKSQEQMCLAGTWDDWTPHDMQWDEKLQCHTFNATLNGRETARFAVNRGQAGTRKWKPGALKKWSMGTAAGSYKIKVFVADSKISNVEWEALAA